MTAKFRARVLLTCPPMLGAVDHFRKNFSDKSVELVCPKIVQTLSEAELIKLLPDFDGWIAGDDPASLVVLKAGVQGKLKAVVKWGIGIDSIDLKAIESLKLKFKNTPGMFGNEVADLAIGMLICLTRNIHEIHQSILAGGWPKPRGISLAGKKAVVFGYGDIGRQIARRFVAMNTQVYAVDPYAKGDAEAGVTLGSAEEALKDAEIIALACPLTKENHHLISAKSLASAKPGVFLVNVARGPLVSEVDLIAALKSGQVRGAALDGFEVEPLASDHPLRSFSNCLFGSHNASNTHEGVVRASEKAMEIMFGFLGV